MKKRILLIIYCLITTLLYANTYIDASEQEWTYGSMHQWRAHNSYTVIEEIVVIDKQFIETQLQIYNLVKIL
jgi:hypothetical protein